MNMHAFLNKNISASKYSYVVCAIFVFAAVAVFGFSSAYAQNAQLAPPTPGAGQNNANQNNGRDASNDFTNTLRQRLEAADAQNVIADQQLQQQNASPGLSLPIEGLPPVSSLSQEELQIELSEEAFDAAVTGLLPLEPSQIKNFLREYDSTQEAVQSPVYPAPKPLIAVENFSLDPGQVPVTVKTGVGYVTTLNFVDSTGSPWPIQDLGWAGDYEVLQPEEQSHVLRVTPLSEFARGNVSVRLLNLETPLVMTFNTDRKDVHYRMDVRVSELGPNAIPATVSGVPVSLSAGNKDLTAVLLGVPPEEAKKLSIRGLDVRSTAFLFNGLTYLRTPHTLLSPAWTSSTRSADGTTVYVLEDAPVLLLSDKGQMVRAYISQEESGNGF